MNVEKYPEFDPEIMSDIKMVRGEKEIDPHDPETERMRERRTFLKYGVKLKHIESFRQEGCALF